MRLTTIRNELKRTISASIELEHSVISSITSFYKMHVNFFFFFNKKNACELKRCMAHMLLLIKIKYCVIIVP